MMKNFKVMVDKGFRGVGAQKFGEWDDQDPEVKANIESGFLVAAGKTKTTTPATAAADEEKKEG